MKHRTYLLPLVLALLLLLSLTACGDSSSDDPQSGYETVMDMEFLDGMWSIDGTSRLYFDSEEGFYAYRTGWGLGGRGEFELSEASGRPMIFFNGFLYNFLLRDDGVLLPNQNGEGSGLTIHRHTFLRDDEAEIVEWDKSNWDGMWQNALGETIVIDSSLMQYIACSPDYSMSGTMNDEGEGFFPKGMTNEAYAQFFNVTSYLQALSTEGVAIANVTFEPGCRNFWHIHHKGGQILLVTGGRGWYQQWEKPARALKPGDVVNIPAGVKHWHGAAKDSWFSHLAVAVPAEGASNEWLEQVSDEEYQQLK